MRPSVASRCENMSPLYGLSTLTLNVDRSRFVEARRPTGEAGLLGLALDGLTGARGKPSVSSLSSMWSSSACTRSSFCGCIFQKPRVSCSFQWRTSFFSSSIVMIAESASRPSGKMSYSLSGARSSSKSSLRRLRDNRRRARARA